MAESSEMRAWLAATKSRGMSLGLATTSAALNALGPGTDAFTVHVAGSNGKGTLCATLAVALQRAGVSTLMFTSPHLVRLEERIRINGVPVSPTTLDGALARVMAVDESMDGVLTFFESTFLAAMCVAETTGVEVLILETGLGGRLDATRCAPADLSVITSLSLEHTDILGPTLRHIAMEKGAIARPGRPLVVQTPDDNTARQAIEACAANAGLADLNEPVGPAKVFWVAPDTGEGYRAQAKTLVKAVWPHLGTVTKAPVPELETVRWPARMQRISSTRPDEPHWLLEGAHNPSGMAKACEELAEHPALQGPWALLFGTTPQTDLRTMVQPLLDLMRHHPPNFIVLTEPQEGRYPGVPCATWLKVLTPVVNAPLVTHPLPHDAVTHLNAHLDDGVTVLSIGSLYMQGNVLTALGATSDEHLTVR